MLAERTEGSPVGDDRRARLLNFIASRRLGVTALMIADQITDYDGIDIRRSNAPYRLLLRDLHILMKEGSVRRSEKDGWPTEYRYFFVSKVLEAA